MPRKATRAYETENSTFAHNLTEIMKEKGENQTTLAAKITSQYTTIQRQTISLYMSGQSKPDTERLTAIAKVLNVSTDWLLGLSGEKTTNGELAQVCNYTGLSKDAVETLVKLKDSPSGYMSVVIDYILSCEGFVRELIGYLSSCVWGMVKKDYIGEYHYSEQSQEETKKFFEDAGVELIETVMELPMLKSFPLLCPDEDLEESISFAQVIKKLPRLYDSFKNYCADCEEFIDAVVQDRVHNMQPKK